MLSNRPLKFFSVYNIQSGLPGSTSVSHFLWNSWTIWCCFLSQSDNCWPWKMYFNIHFFQVVEKETGHCTETMRRKAWHVRDFIGQEAHVRLVDYSSGGWGHINFDDLQVGLGCPGNFSLLFSGCEWFYLGERASINNKNMQWWTNIASEYNSHISMMENHR